MIEATALAVIVLSVISAAPLAPPPTVTVNPVDVDAVADSQVVLKVPVAGMVRIAVQSEVGTACTLVDHQRGPFLSDGVVGKKSCNVDVLLDAGLYKLRLQSPDLPAGTPKKAPRPQAKVTASLFGDVDASRLLPAGVTSTTTLPGGRQLVRLVRVERRREVVLDVAGRTAGEVRLWRDGTFIDEVTFQSQTVRGAPGRPVWHHHTESVLDAGDYAVVVYGTRPQAFTTGSDDDTVFVAHDARPLPVGGGLDVTLPAWGFVQAKAPGGELAVMASTGPGVDVTVGTTTVGKDDELGERRRGRGAGCTIAATSAQRTCAFLGGGSDHTATVLTVTGPAGTTVRLQAVPVGGARSGRSFGPAHAALETKLTMPSPLLSVVTWPPAVDEAPLSCLLEKMTPEGVVQATIAVDAPSIGWTQAYKTRFNVDGTVSAIWLDLEKPGLYAIGSDKALNASCELFSVVAGERTRLGEGSAPCNTRIALPKGLVEVRLYGGTPGVQTLRVGQAGVATLLGDDRLAPPRTGCTFNGGAMTGTLPAGRYRVRTTATKSTSFVGVLAAGTAPVGPMIATSAFDAPLLVAVDAGRPIAIDVAAGDAVEVVAATPGARIACALDGVPVGGCRLEQATVSGRLVVTTDGPSTLATVRRPAPPPPDPLLQALTATAPNLPTVAAGTTRFFDLDGTTARSFLVDVKEPGLYRIETTGLLGTRCTVRTATSAALFAGERNGRGRNCRVEAFLKPGRFRVDVRALGSSRGRAGLSLVPQPITDVAAITPGDERFLSVPAGVPARHRLESKGQDLDVVIEAQDAELQCRVDDDDGWPMRVPPHACRLQERLPAGRYSVTVFPLSVESRRAVRATTTTTTTTLKGNSVHALALNTVVKATLGSDGSDRFRFVLPAETSVGITLGNAVQGRLRPALEGGAVGDVVGIVAPVGGGWSLGGDDDGSSDGDGGYEGDGESYEGESSEGESYEGEGDGGGDGSERTTSRGLSTAAMAAATVHQAAPALSGQTFTLAAGTWILETEHSRGDVGIDYDVGVFVRELVPGAAIAVQAPAVLDVLAPASGELGLVRLKTRGPTDTACRLLDERGDTVLSSTSSGDDWNCAMALPLVAGARHKLLVDAEVLRPGPTTVEASFLPAKSTGELKDGDRFRVVGKVARADITPVAGQVVDVELTATDGRFSCAVFDADGRVLTQLLDVARCPLLVSTGDDVRALSLMVWTADRPASVVASRAGRSVRRGGGLLAGSADDGSVVEVEIARRGRFALAPGLWCRPKLGVGAFSPCDGEVAADPSLDGGAILLAAPRGQSASAAVTEIVAELTSTTSSSGRLVRGPRASERQRSSTDALHLVDVRVRAGASAQPACGIDGGAAVAERDRCVAASGLTRESQLSLWTRPGGSANADVNRRAVVVPASTPLPPATTAALRVTGPVRFTLPNSAHRTEVARSDDAWVVLLDDQARAVDVCPPATSPRGALARCVLRGRGGSVVVAPATARAHDVRIETVTFDGPVEPPRTLAGLREVNAAAAGQERLVFASAREARRLVVEGGAVAACGVTFDDGRRLESDRRGACDVAIPAGVAGTVAVEHRAGPWRALLERPWLIPALRIGPTGDGPGITMDKSVGLTGTSVIRRVDVAGGALRLRASSGTCAVLTTTEPPRTLAASGDDGGCDLHVPVPAGVYRVAVRGFAGRPLSGTMSVQRVPTVVLDEGRGDEVVVLPGESRFFRVPLAGDGELGLGLQVDADVFSCTLRDDSGATIADGCQVFTRVKKGQYSWQVTLRDGDQPRRYRPVVFGLKGAEVDVPDDWLRDFFARIPRTAASATTTDAPVASEVR